jgi:hypothetical protein
MLHKQNISLLIIYFYAKFLIANLALIFHLLYQTILIHILQKYSYNLRIAFSG